MKKLFLFIALFCFVPQALAFGLNFDRNSKEKPASEYEQEAYEARVLYAQNNIEEAMNAIIAIPAEERTAENWLLLGNIQQDKGNVKEAVFAFDNAVLCDPKSYKAYYNLGVIYFEEEKYALALENFLKAKHHKNDLANIYYNIGCCYLKLGEFKRAKNELLYAIQLKNNEPNYYYNLALVYKKLNNDKKAQYYLDFYEKMLNR